MSLCGYFDEFSMPVANFETAKEFWEPLGFVATDESDMPYVHLPLTSDYLNIAFHRPRTLDRPMLVFSDPDMPARIARLRELGIPFSDELPRGLTPAETLSSNPPKARRCSSCKAKAEWRQDNWPLLLILLLALPAFGDEGMWTFHDFPQALVKQRYGVDITQAWLDRVGPPRCACRDVRHRSCRQRDSSSPTITAPTAAWTRTPPTPRTSSKTASWRARVTRNSAARHRSPMSSWRWRTSRTRSSPRSVTSIRPGRERRPQEAADPTRAEPASTTVPSRRPDRSNANPWISTRAASTGSTNTNATMICGWFSRPRKTLPPSAATRTTSSFHAGAWTCRCCVRTTRTESPRSRQHILRIRPEGPKPGEPVFVSGHPGATDRLLTVAELQELRDVFLPQWLLRASELRGRYIQYRKDQPRSTPHSRKPPAGPGELHQGAAEVVGRPAGRAPVTTQARGGVRTARETQSAGGDRLAPTPGSRSRRRSRPSASCRCPTRFSSRGPDSTAGCTLMLEHWSAAPRSARSPTASGSANTVTRPCRASSSS